MTPLVPMALNLLRDVGIVIGALLVVAAMTALADDTVRRCRDGGRTMKTVDSSRNSDTLAVYEHAQQNGRAALVTPPARPHDTGGRWHA